MRAARVSNFSQDVDIKALAFGGVEETAVAVAEGDPLPVRDITGGTETLFRSGELRFVPVAAATDFVAIAPQYYGRSAFIRRVTISGTATAAAVLDVIAQRSLNGGGGTFVVQPTGSDAIADSYSATRLYTFTANRTGRGNGVSNERPILAVGKLHLGTAAVKAVPLVFDFGRGIALHDIEEWFVLNLNGQTIPAGCSLDIFVEWAEAPVPSLFFVGDSTTSNATHMFKRLVSEWALHGMGRFANYGSNGYRLIDYLMGAGGVPWPMKTVNPRLAGRNGALVFSYGLNDMRQGANSEADLISLIDAAIHATLNGTVSGASYTSPHGAGTTFTWPDNIDAAPDTRIILWGCNAAASDGNASNFIVLNGQYNGMTLPAAAQKLSDQVRNAHAYFRNDPRVFRVIQKQDALGATSIPISQSGTMTDSLHPNARGQQLLADQIIQPARAALQSVKSGL